MHDYSYCKLLLFVGLCVSLLFLGCLNAGGVWFCRPFRATLATTRCWKWLTNFFAATIMFSIVITDNNPEFIHSCKQWAEHRRLCQSFYQTTFSWRGPYYSLDHGRHRLPCSQYQISEKSQLLCVFLGRQKYTEHMNAVPSDKMSWNSKVSIICYASPNVCCKRLPDISLSFSVQFCAYGAQEKLYA